jgi:hypothetical protein
MTDEINVLRAENARLREEMTQQIGGNNVIISLLEDQSGEIARSVIAMLEMQVSQARAALTQAASHE